MRPIICSSCMEQLGVLRECPGVAMLSGGLAVQVGAHL